LSASLTFKVLQTQKGQTSAWPSQLLYAHQRQYIRGRG